MNGKLTNIAITNAQNSGIRVVYTNFAGYGYGYSVNIGGSVFKQSLTRGLGISKGIYRRELISSVTNTFNGTHLTGYAYTYDPLKRPTLRNDDTFDYNSRNEVISASLTTNTVHCQLYLRIR